MSTTATGGIEAALWVLIGAYLFMGVLTWALYLRPGARLAALKV